MKKWILLLSLLLLPTFAFAQLTTTQGGTGTSSPSGILFGDGTLHLKTLTIGSNLSLTGGTLSATGGSGGSGVGTVATSSLETKGQLPYWTSTNGYPALLGSIATTSLSSGSGISFSGIAGALVGGTNLSIAVAGLTTGNFSSANISQWTNNSGYLTSLAGAASSTLLGDANTFSGVDSFTNASSNFSGTWQTFSPSHFQTALTLPLSVSNGGTGASSLTGLITTADLASANISQFTNNSGYLTSLAGAASSTLLGDTNTFSGLDKFSNSTSTLASLGTTWFTGITGSTQCLHVDTNGKISGTGTDCGSSGGSVTGVTATYPILSSGGTAPVISTAFGTTSTWGIANDGFVYTSHTGIPLVVASSSLNLPNTALQNSSITVNGQLFNLGDTHTITAASSSLLGDSDTFSGTLDAFSNTIKVASLGGFIGGNAGSLYSFATSTIKTSQLTNDAGFLTSAVTSVTGTWPIISSGGTSPAISYAGFGTTSDSGIGHNLILYTNNSGVVVGAASSSLALPTSALASQNISQFTNNSGYITGNQTITLSGVVTGSGATAITTAFGNANAGTVLDNPTGSTAAPTFNATSTFFGSGTGGQVLSWNNGVPQWVATSSINNGVTSVSGSGGTTGLTLTGGPITTTGTLTLGGTLAIANGGTNATSFTGDTVPYLNHAGTSLVGGFSTSTMSLGSVLATITNASTTQLTVANGLQIPNSSNPAPTIAGYLSESTNSPYQLHVGNGASGTAVFDPRVSFTFGISTSTAWTGSTTAPVVDVPTGLTWNSISCSVQPSGATLDAQYQYANPTTFASVLPTMIAASSTNGVTTWTTNNTPATNATSTITFGTPASSPTSISCTLTGVIAPI